MSSKRPDQYENFLTFLHSLKTSNSPTNNNTNINRTIENEYLTNTQKFYDDHFGRNYDSEDEDNQNQNIKNQPQQKGVSEIKTKSKKISQSELSTKGALDLAKDYHEDVDDLLELCDQVNQAAADSIEEQGVNRNESSDPIQEDMFKVVFGFLFCIFFFSVKEKNR